MIVLTGAAGFIGNHLVKHCLVNSDESLVCIDNLSYAANLPVLERSVVKYASNRKVEIINANIGEKSTIANLLRYYQPRAVINLAAESHIPNSENNQQVFLRTNQSATMQLFQTCLDYWQTLSRDSQSGFRFIQISTNETYKPLKMFAQCDKEYDPRGLTNLYSQTKAATDLSLIKYFRKYGFPALINCSCNVFGKWQHNEKLIPRVINEVLRKQTMPLFDNGNAIHEWLPVEDLVAALYALSHSGVPGKIYSSGSGQFLSARKIAEIVCENIDEIAPDPLRLPHCQFLTSAPKRHWVDKRYPLDGTELSEDTGWAAKTDFRDALTNTVNYYVQKAFAADLE